MTKILLCAAFAGSLAACATAPPRGSQSASSRADASSTGREVAAPSGAVPSGAVPWRVVGDCGLDVATLDLTAPPESVLSHDDARLRWAAALRLGEAGSEPKRVPPVLLEILTQGPVPARVCAAARLANYPGSVGEAIPALLTALGDEEARVRAASARALGSLGEAGAVAAQSLVLALDDQDSDVRCAAVAALGYLGVADRRALPGLVRALSHEEPAVRATAADILGRLGPDAAEAVPELTRQLDDAVTVPRRAAAQALGSIGPPAYVATPRLVGLLGDEDEWVRARAATALGQFDSNAEEVRVALAATALGDASVPCRSAAIAALAAYGLSSLPVLVAALEDPDSRVQVRSVEGLGTLGSPALPALTKAFNQEPALSPAVLRTLASMDSGAEVIVPACLQALESGHIIDACLVLSRLGPEAVTATPALVEALRDSDDEAFHYAVSALGRVSRGAVPDLISFLRDPDARVRRGVAIALGSMGVHATAAIDPLWELITDRDSLTRRAAQDALDRIRGKDPNS